MKFIALSALIVCTSSHASEPKTLDYGPTPTFEYAVKISESAARANLIDPDSAKFEWPYNFVAGTLKPIFAHTHAGFWTCGRINSRNRLGGYTGRAWLLVMVNNGAVTQLDIGESGNTDVASVNCENAIKKGELPLSRAETQLGNGTAANSVAAALPPLEHPIGIQFQPSVLGALIVSVQPDSLGARAGLQVGQIITAVNGVQTKDFPPAQMITLVRTSSKIVVYSILGAGDVKIER
jgi:hypothetical protein